MHTQRVVTLSRKRVRDFVSGAARVFPTRTIFSRKRPAFPFVFLVSIRVKRVLGKYLLPILLRCVPLSSADCLNENARRSVLVYKILYYKWVMSYITMTWSIDDIHLSVSIRLIQRL